MAYYYINGFSFNGDKTKVDRLSGYLTNVFHSSFLPPKTYSRKEVITLIKTGNTVFIEDGAYHKICLGVFDINGDEFIRADKHPAPFDYFG